MRIGGVLYSGSVEIHRDASDWTHHRHHEDDRYNDVILHVALSARTSTTANRTRSGRLLPVMLLGRHLDGGSLLRQARWNPPGPAPVEHALPCASVNELMPADLLLGWLTRLGNERLARTSLRWGQRLTALLDEMRDPGGAHTGAIADRATVHHTRSDFVSPVLWNQALYEALMEGLGYAKNRQAFRTLARTIPLASLRRLGLDDTDSILAVFFGSSHLLPDPGALEDPLVQRYAAELRDRWGALSHAFPPTPLHASDWLFFRLRPANAPTARIAAFAHAIPVIFRSGFHGCLDILRSATSIEDAVRRLRNILVIRAGGFWRYRTSFEGSAMGCGSAIGRGRATEMLVNAILPLSLRFADTFGDAALRNAVQAILEDGPAAPPHRLLSRMHADLFHGPCAANSPLLSQGAIALYRDYCVRLRCRACAVGVACGFVRSSVASSWPRERGCC